MDALISRRKTLMFLCFTVLIIGLSLSHNAIASLKVCPSECEYTDIQSAIDDVSNGGTIHVSSGIYTGNLSVINKSIKLKGKNPSQTIIQGFYTGEEVNPRVIDISCDSTAHKIIIANVTITRGIPGSLGFGGGGLINVGCNVLIKDSIITHNSSRAAGGISNATETMGKMQIKNTIISNNNAFDLGGGGIRNNGKLMIIDSNVTNNNARSGGGGIDNGGLLQVKYSFIANNNARLGGGIANATSGTAVIIESSILNNEASQRGGGIANFNVMKVRGSLLAYNESQQDGGGLYNSSASILDIKETIITTNAATNSGGGLFDLSSSISASGLTIVDNTPDNCGGGIFFCP